MTEHYKDWLKKADEDLKTVEILFKDEGFSASIVCYHCQQTGEKYLKAFLVAHNIEFLKTHDLEILIESFCLPINNEFIKLKEEAILLSDYAVELRYPGDFYEASVEDAKEAYQAALKIKDFVLSKLKTGNNV